jgi:hypothetical protein
VCKSLVVSAAAFTVLLEDNNSAAAVMPPSGRGGRYRWSPIWLPNRSTSRQQRVCCPSDKAWESVELYRTVAPHRLTRPLQLLRKRATPPRLTPASHITPLLSPTHTHFTPAAFPAAGLVPTFAWSRSHVAVFWSGFCAHCCFF